MTKRIYSVQLTVDEQNKLHAICATGKASVRLIQRAHILLSADENRPGGKLTDSNIAKELYIHTGTVYKVRKSFTEKGLKATLERKKRTTPPTAPKVTGELEAKIIALFCSEPPAGRSRWSMRLLASQAVELQYIDSISYDTVDRIIKKAKLNLTSSDVGAAR